jgi:hypothetical protein
MDPVLGLVGYTIHRTDGLLICGPNRAEPEESPLELLALAREGREMLVETFT